MTKQLVFTAVGALLVGVVWYHISQTRSAVRERENALKRVVELQEENKFIKKMNDSLADRAIILDVQMTELEVKADSLANLATLPMPCEHELELRKEEITAVRGALAKCKEAKTIQTTRVGLSEIRVENQIKICDKLTAIQKKDMKKEKRKAFFKGAGVGGLVVGILIILAL